MEVMDNIYKVTGFKDLLDIMKTLKDEEDIKNFVFERLEELDAKSFKGNISMCSNGKLNGSVTWGYINSQTPITSSFLVDPFYVNDPSLYIEFLKYIKDKDCSDFIRLIHHLQSFSTDTFGYKGDQRIRENVYLSLQSERDISISDFYENNSALCSERSAAIHNLTSFCGINSFLIFGKMKTSDDEMPFQHAYNIFQKKDGFFILFDGTNPVKLLEGEKAVVVPAYQLIDEEKDINNLSEVKFDSKRLASYYNRPLYPEEPERIYYVPQYSKSYEDDPGKNK